MDVLREEHARATLSLFHLWICRKAQNGSEDSWPFTKQIACAHVATLPVGCVKNMSGSGAPDLA